MATYNINLDANLNGSNSYDVLLALIHHMQNILDDDPVSLGLEESLNLSFNLSFYEEDNY